MVHEPDQRTLRREDFRTMTDQRLLELHQKHWYRNMAARELKRRGIDPERIGRERTPYAPRPAWQR